MNKSSQLKGITPPSLELFLDDTMMLVPRVMVDLADEEKRTLLRNWMRNICGHLTHQLVCSMTDATRKVVDEAGALMIDPQYYENSKKRRTRNIQARKQRAAERASAEREKAREIITPGSPFLM